MNLVFANETEWPTNETPPVGSWKSKRKIIPWEDIIKKIPQEPAEEKN